MATRLRRSSNRGVGSVLITGWYGSETVGDVAILGQVIKELREAVPEASVSVASFDAERTRESLAQLGEEFVGVAKVGFQSGVVQGRCDLLVFGGGPLMESPTMWVWLARAFVARLGGALVVVHSCGIGPIRQRGTRRAVLKILALAQLVMLRDTTSAREVTGVAGSRRPLVTFDPAFDYVQAQPRSVPLGSEGGVALALRVPSSPYLGAQDEPVAWRAKFAREMAGALDDLYQDGLTFRGIVMYEDENESDRDIYVEIAAQMRYPNALTVAPGPHTVKSVVANIDASVAVVAVRFHGFIFALARDAAVVAVDYTSPHGKTTAAALDVGVADQVLAADSMTAEALAERVRAVIRGRPVRSESCLLPCEGPTRRIQAIRTLVEQRQHPLRASWRTDQYTRLPGVAR